MSKSTLVRYIRLVLESVPDARVPNQLIDTEDAEEAKGNEAEDVNEFSGVGAVAGFTAPLGAEPVAKKQRKKHAR